MTGPRDWDKEMAEIDKIIASGKAPTAPAGGTAPVRESSPSRSAVAVAQPASSTVTRRRDKLAIWFRTILGLGGAVALAVWPYGTTCGTMLYLYLLSAFALIMIGIWAMRGAWTHRRGVAHIGGLLVLLAGLSFAAFTVFQRTGYAAARLGWVCSAPASPAPATQAPSPTTQVPSPTAQVPKP